MPASLQRIRETMDVKPTVRDKGLTLTLRLTAYDTGMLELDTVPLNDPRRDDPAVGWLNAAEVITATLSEFRRHVAAREQKPR